MAEVEEQVVDVAEVSFFVHFINFDVVKMDVMCLRHLFF
jgi:hypothetical protein